MLAKEKNNRTQGVLLQFTNRLILKSSVQATV